MAHSKSTTSALETFWAMADTERAEYLIDNGRSSRPHLQALASKLAARGQCWYSRVPNYQAHQFYAHLCRIVDGQEV